MRIVNRTNAKSHPLNSNAKTVRQYVRSDYSSKAGRRAFREPGAPASGPVTSRRIAPVTRTLDADTRRRMIFGGAA